MAQAFVAGVQAATKRPFTPPTVGECRALLEAVTAHSRGSKGHELISWTREAAERFARSDPPAVSVWKFRDWLDAGERAWRRPGVSANVQNHPEGFAFKLPEGVR